MKKVGEVFSGFRGMKLRKQLMSGFLSLSVLIGVTGASGLFFAYQIGTTVGGFTELASPLTAESSQLIEATEKARINLLEVLASDQESDIEAARANLSDLRASSAEGIERLAELVAAGNLPLDLTTATSLQTQFVDQAMAMLQARQQELAAVAAANAKFAEFEVKRQELEKALKTFAQQSESTMSAREDQGRTLIQSGSASVDDLGVILDETFNRSFPVVRGAYALMGYLVNMQEVARTAISAQDAAELPALEKSFKKLVKKSKSRLKRIRSRGDAEQKKSIKAMTAGVGEFESMVLGEDGLLAAYSGALDAKTAAARLGVRLANTSYDYEEALGVVSAAARTLSDKLSKSATDATTQALLAIGIVVLVGMILGAFCAVVISRAITRPLMAITNAMQALAGGNKEIEVANQEDSNEIGDLARALLVFRDNAVEAEHMAAEQAAEQAAKEERAKLIEVLCDTFDRDATEALRLVSEGATNMIDNAQSMVQTAGATSDQAREVSDVSDRTAQSVNLVATSAEELSSSISEISHQVTQSTEISRQAVEQAANANTTVEGLAEAAKKIGEVVQLIQEIAEQTNLLALNATIEAARAGDAGKGFAVVASEVKSLANQTAKATEEISMQITAMQTATTDTVGAIGTVRGIIDQIGDTATSIASAVEEQNAATQEISRNVQEVAGGIQEVSATMGSVSQATAQTQTASDQSLDAAERLSTQSQELSDQVQKFLQGLKAA